MLKSSRKSEHDIFPPNRAGSVSLDYRESKDSVLQTGKMVFAPLRLESYSTDGQLDTRTD